MSNILRVAVNRRFKNKIEKGNKALFNVLTRDCKNVELTLTELAASINQGYAFCAQHSDRRKDENFICSDVLAVDIDDGMTIAEALANPFVQEFGGIIYPTPSHTEEHQRFRIVFASERTITDPAEMRAAYIGLIRKFGGDQSCKDACRAFYGSEGSNPIILGKLLTNEKLDQLIELGGEPVSVPDRSSTDGKKSYPIASRRSGVAIAPDHPVTCANGVTMPFKDVPYGDNIHCPVQAIDRNPSAFIVKSKEGHKGLYCHSCAATYWMKSHSRKMTNDFDFYRADAIITQMEYEQDPGSYYDEDTAPPGFFDQAYSERTAHTLSQRYLLSSDIEIRDGVTFICSEKESGKTQLLVDKVRLFMLMGKSVLLVGHRQTLLQQMAARLGLTNYFYIDGSKVRKNQPTPYFAICIDSMTTQLKPKRDKYDVVILDESEQCLSHLTGSTLKDNRRASYIHLFHYMSAAKYVIVADADLGPITVEGVYQAMGPDVEYRYYLNQHREGKRNQRDFHFYDSEPHLTQDMLKAIGAGGRHYIATNSITKANELQAAIRLVHGDELKIMLVTSKTARTMDVQKFINDIKVEILKYDVVIASPTLGTGIDISFPNAAQLIDTVYGYFVTRVNAHFDVDQQLSRVRNPKAIKVWVAADTYSFETEPEVILREAAMNGLLNDALIGISRDGDPVLDKTYLNVYAKVTSIARASKNNLRDNLLALRKRNGANVIHVEEDLDDAKVGKVVKADAKNAVEDQRIEDICVAERLSAASYSLLRENAAPLTKEEDDAMQRFELESFYREDATTDLLVLDKKGAYRSQLALLEIYLSPTDKLAAKDSHESELATIITDRKNRAIKQLMLKALFTQAGLADDNNPLKTDAEITSNDLMPFATFCLQNSARLEALFGMSVHEDVHKKPMSQLSSVLGRIGLTLQNHRSKKAGKNKIRYYQIHPGKWKSAVHYLRRRLPMNDPTMKYLIS